MLSFHSVYALFHPSPLAYRRLLSKNVRLLMRHSFFGEMLKDSREKMLPMHCFIQIFNGSMYQNELTFCHQVPVQSSSYPFFCAFHFHFLFSPQRCCCCCLFYCFAVISFNTFKYHYIAELLGMVWLIVKDEMNKIHIIPTHSHMYINITIEQNHPEQ